MKQFKFTVNGVGDPSVGIPSWSEDITVTIAHGNTYTSDSLKDMEEAFKFYLKELFSEFNDDRSTRVYTEQELKVMFTDDDL